MFVAVGVVGVVVGIGSTTADAAPPAHRHRTTTKKVADHDRVAPPSLVVPLQTDPPPPPPSVTLAAGAVLIHTALEISLAKDSAVAPASFAPDFSAGITDDLTLAVVTSASGMTGFRGSAGFGFCFTGELDGKCRKPFAGGGVEGLYALSRGTFAIAANAGILATTTDPVHTDFKLGFKTKLTLAQTSVVFSPSIWIALNDRGDPALPHEHQLWLPLSVWQKVVPSVALGVGTGIKGPLARFDSRWSIPVGLLAQFSIDKRASVGTSFVFGRIVAGDEVMDPGLDARVLQLWVSVASR